MLSMMEINMMLKDNFQRQLQEIKDLPEDLAKGYKVWVRGLVKAAAQQITADTNTNTTAPTQETGGQDVQTA